MSLISAFASFQQGRQAKKIADLNASLQRSNADLQKQMGLRQVRAQRVMFDQQRAALQQQQDANLAQAKEAIRRTEEAKEQMLSKQRAAYAGAGIVMQGTPLAVQSDTEAKFSTAQADTLYETEVRNHALRYEMSGLDYRKKLLKIDEAGIKAGARIANFQANITALQGRYDRQAGYYKAADTLISDAAKAYSGGAGG